MIKKLMLGLLIACAPMAHADEDDEFTQLLTQAMAISMVYGHCYLETVPADYLTVPKVSKLPIGDLLLGVNGCDAKIKAMLRGLPLDVNKDKLLKLLHSAAGYAVVFEAVARDEVD